MELVFETGETAKWAGYTMIDSIALDASLEELHSMTAETTGHPIEDGSDASDHVQRKPRVVRIQGLISNHPITKPASHASGVTEVKKEFEWKAAPQVPGVQIGGPGLIGAATGGIASAIGADVHKGTAWGFEPVFDRVIDVYAEFEKIWNESRIVTIVTTLHVYPDMIIESLDVDRSASTGRTLSFVATARQITVVQTAIAEAANEPKIESGKHESAQGKKASQELPDGDPAGEKLKSATIKLLGW